MNPDNPFCIILPAYKESGRISRVIEGLAGCGGDVLVVDDGSPDSTADEAERSGAIVLRHKVNRGKGAALETGFAFARSRGYSFVVTMDADGQHDPADLPGMIEVYRTQGVRAVVGSRMWNHARMPFVRRMTNLFMSWLLSREMGQYVPDTQSGYRLYDSEILPLVKTESARFAAESEVLLALSDAGVRIGSAPISVIYRDEKSKIRPVRDTVRFFAMLRSYRVKRRLNQDMKRR